MQTTLSSIDFYNCNENSARNFNKVVIGNLITLWYSYETIVAFRTPLTGFCATENVWGTTTGKHLNWLCEKSQRLPREEFVDKLNSVLLSIELKEVSDIEHK